MHNCEEFRERITELIIDRKNVAAQAEFQSELLMCSSCSEFYVQSQEMIAALDEIDLTVSDSHWNEIETRMVDGIHAQQPVEVYKPRRFFQWRLVFAAAALLLITIGLSRMSTPPPTTLTPDTAQAVYVEHAVPLDPVTVDFLEESELLLRNVMKMAPHDTDDLADAKKVAREQLAELDQRKAAAADVPPVVGVMETYETILRDLRNVDERSADEDIGDIRTRIQLNGLIANMKAFQPRVTEVSFSLR